MSPDEASPPLGEANGVWKAFGETQALRDVSIRVRSGRCHGLVGRNGAGKSTLVSLLTGLVRPDRGRIALGGEPAPGLADRAAWQRRVACVYQRSMVVPSLTVAENVFLNRPVQGRAGLVDWRGMRAQARRVLGEWGFDLDVDRLAGDLTVEQRQIVEIARALSVGARLLVLDEPTASLEKAAIDRLVERIRRLQAGGVGVLYISHHLEEIYDICDELTVLRDGARVLSAPVAEVSHEQLVAAMVGAAPAPGPRDAATSPVPRGAVRLQLDDVLVRSAGGDVEGVSLTVAAGECVGLVGLHGSGTGTVAEAIVGLARPRGGRITLEGRPLPPGRTDLALARGVAFVPDDRHARGLVPLLGVGENLTLAVLDRLTSRLGIVSGAQRSRVAADLVARLSIVASGHRQPVGELSGGNQQKVVVGRALATEPAALVVMAPTVGVDVASKQALLRAVAGVREAGVAVLLVSDDLEDLRICTRLLIMVRGRIVREMDEPPWDEHELIAAVEGLEATA